MFSRKLLFRNALLNFAGQIIPLGVGLITVPIVISGLGKERFGLLSLAWAILTYLSILDFGLARATIKYASEALAKGEFNRVLNIVWTAVLAQSVLGVVSAILLVYITPFLVGHILKIPPELIREAKDMFLVVALSVPLALVSRTFRGALEAAQRFDLVNAVMIPMNSAIFLLPLAGLALGFELAGILALVLVAMFVAFLSLVLLTLRSFHKPKAFSIQSAFLPRLLTFGGWVMVTTTVSPLLTYLERFIIGALLSMGAVAYYSAPYEAVTRLCVIPGSLVATLFPAFSALSAIKDNQSLEVLFESCIKYILLALGPIVVALTMFGDNILQIWLWTDFALESSRVLRILAIGVLVNSLAYIPFAFLQGIGRPDLPAKFHLLEIPFYVVMTWGMVTRWGIDGAAMAWTIRVSLDAFFLFAASFKMGGCSPKILIDNGLPIVYLSLSFLIALTYIFKNIVRESVLQVAFFCTLVSFFGWVLWEKALHAKEKEAILIWKQH